MRICLVLEGSYPYVHGGVSTWMHQYITEMKEHEFIIWVIGANEEKKGAFVYEFPENVVEVHEVFLDSLGSSKIIEKKSEELSREEYDALKQLVFCAKPDWSLIFDLLQEGKIQRDDFLVSEAFFQMIQDLCEEKYAAQPMSDVFHTIRSILFPLLMLLTSEIPIADAYHAICTGYGGILATLASYRMRKQWIDFFYMLSDAIYSKADCITSLFSKARETQIEIGCEPNKCRVISNGIDYESFSKIPFEKDDDSWINIGAAVRMAPIKDIKTMIYAFYEVSAQIPNVRLYIMGGVDDKAYAEECYALARKLKLENLIFTGRVDIKEYLRKMDFMILTSISEGQPLSILESMAAGKPCVTTDVGCCKELLEGREDDELGVAGYCVPPTDLMSLAHAMIVMARSEEKRLKMGQIAKKRSEQFYQYHQMIEQYRQLYKEYVR
ncbi:GT4 family glycosyltransferase PelF [Streptococcus anginosus]|uniref:GT4 family glycosyltransferase PelF n=1 Tax=Streptococcus anginosus TaxID=1328 RepID=UPI002001BF2B|nr:GT4 family glycosyltransferase PelF [Streptococcus anginosus]